MAISLSSGMTSGASESGCGDWVADNSVDAPSVESLLDEEGIDGVTVDGEAVGGRSMIESSFAGMIAVTLALTLDSRSLV